MMYRLCIVGFTCSVSLAVAIAVAQDQITEGDIVTLLDGKPPAIVSSQPTGVAIYVTFPASQPGGGQGERSSQRATPGEEALYKSLIPLARALEAEVLRGSRYLIRVVPASPQSAEEAVGLGQHLADAVEHFLTTYFAIPRERLSLRVVPAEPAAEGLMTATVRPQRWKLEVFRQE